jgi:hypothetical protein
VAVWDTTKIKNAIPTEMPASTLIEVAKEDRLPVKINP